MIIRQDLLSMPNVPKPLHGISPRTIMGKDAWDAMRRDVYETTGHHCAACGVHKSRAKCKKWMEAHEIYDIDYRSGTATMVEIVPLCHFCHAFIHSGLLRMQARKKEVSADHVRWVINHGVSVLRDSKHQKIFAGTAELAALVSVPIDGLIVSDTPSKMAEWGKWRMIWDGKQHKGKFRSFNDWRRHYA